MAYLTFHVQVEVVLAKKVVEMDAKTPRKKVVVVVKVA